MSEQNVQETLADHTRLFDHPHCSTARVSVIQDLQANQYKTARTRLKWAYADHFDINDADWAFLESLARVRNGITTTLVLTHGEGELKDCIFTDLLKGHGPIRDLYDAQIGQLIDAGLLRRPRICGEKRTRIIRKPYYVLTPEATDCIDIGMVGPRIGDLGESVTHSIGARLYGQYMKHRIAKETDWTASVNYYDDLILDEHSMDVAVYVSTDEHSSRDLYAVGEVKTVLSSATEARNSLYKMGNVHCEHKHWIAPRRELINEIVNVAARREWYSMAPVPKTLAVATNTGLRSTNDRLEASTYTAEGPGLPPTPPITEGFSYEMLYRHLNRADPTLFDAPQLDHVRL